MIELIYKRFMLHCCLLAYEEQLIPIPSPRRILDDSRRTPTLIHLLPPEPYRQKQPETTERRSITKVVEVSWHQNQQHLQIASLSHHATHPFDTDIIASRRNLPTRWLPRRTSRRPAKMLNHPRSDSTLQPHNLIQHPKERQNKSPSQHYTNHNPHSHATSAESTTPASASSARDAVSSTMHSQAVNRRKRQSPLGPSRTKRCH